MASKHQLSLELPDTNNQAVLRVFDTSLYSTDLAVDCGVLQIISPGYNLPVSIDVLPNFNLVLNACTLGIQNMNCGTESSDLPDGIYRIKYSVSPNSNVYVEYDYLRVTQTVNRYYYALGDLELADEMPDADVMEKLDELRLIKSFIDAAKVKVEYTHELETGMELFLYAQKKLLKYIKDC